jgi:restriction modification system DNA specificity domain protein
VNRIDDMIRQMCPDGVQKIRLGAVAEFSRTKTDSETLDRTTFVGVDNLLPNKRGRIDATHSANTSTVTGFAPGDILLGNIRPYLKKIWHADRSGGCSGDVLAIHVFNNASMPISTKYLYYVLSSDRFFLYDQQHSKGAKMPRGSKAAIMEFEIFTPPPKVQQEIVAILDKFVALEAELEAELEARQQQYAYYLDQLLDFSGRREVPWKRLLDVGIFQRGKRFTKADYADTGIPCIHYGEIYTRYDVWTDRVASHLRKDTLARLRFAEPGDVVIVDVGEVVEDVGRSVAWVGDKPAAIHDHCYAFRTNLNPVFVSYLMRTSWFRREKVKHIARTKVKTLLIDGFSSIRIPVPPRQEQDRIVKTLNLFDTLISDISFGLPVEIKARRQQYEYYRDKLLTFPEKAV